MTEEVKSDRNLQNKAVVGILLMIFGLALYPLADAFTKHLMGTYSVPQTTFLRAVTRLVPLFIAVFFQGGLRRVFATAHPQRHLVRLGVNLVYTLCFMYAMSQASLTTVYTISYTSPFFMIILSALLLKESVNWQRWAAVAVGMVGVVIAMKPGSNVFEIAGLVVLLGTFLGALNKILMRRLASTEHSLAIAIYPNIMMMLIMSPIVLFSWQSMPWSDWGLFAILGAVAATGQYVIAQALRFAQGSALAPIDYSTYFWVVALDFFWWEKTPQLEMVIGAAIIVGSNFYILYQSRREQAAKLTNG